MGTFSKLVICVVMLRGRHRGLPVALDRAIVFPTEFVHKASEKVKELKTKRRVNAATSHAAAPTPVGQGEKLPPVSENATSCSAILSAINDFSIYYSYLLSLLWFLYFWVCC
jgi:hypothetical protein